MTAMEARLLTLQERGEEVAEGEGEEVWSRGNRGTWVIRGHGGGGAEGWS